MMDFTTSINVSGSGEGSSLTLEKLMEAKRRIDALGPPQPAVRIIQDSNAVQTLQAKVYPKRKAKSPAHLRRMNNKWRKRFGFTYKPAMYQMDLASTGLGPGKVLIVHPALMPKFRAAVKAGESR